MARPTMTTLIGRLRELLADDAELTDDRLEVLLDDHATSLDVALVPRAPFYTRHESPFEHLEDGATVYVGYNTALTVDVDYTIDLQRGIVTTPAADYRGLRLFGTAYDLHAAAADGWELIASRYVGQFDFTDAGNQYIRSQQHKQARAQAARHRAQAWAAVATVERSDSGQPSGAADRILDGFRRSFR